MTTRIEADSGDEAVLGKRHPVRDGRVCVHILAPFGQCAAEAEPELGPEPERELLRRLYEVCRWAEANAASLVAEDASIRASLEGRPELLDPDGLSEALMALGDQVHDNPAAVDAITARAHRFEVELEALVLAVAQAKGCPWPEVAASSWDYLAMNAFYEGGRHSLGWSDDGRRGSGEEETGPR